MVVKLEVNRLFQQSSQLALLRDAKYRLYENSPVRRSARLSKGMTSNGEFDS